MTRTLLRAAALAAFAAPAFAQAPITREVECRGWGDDDRERYCEEREYTLAAGDMLEVDAGQNGGIRVTGWDRDEIVVVARVRATGDDLDEARERAGAVRILTGQRVSAEGPSHWGDGHWWAVSYEVRAPHALRLLLEARNGGIALEELTGDVEARTRNGGIRVVGGAGRIRGQTTNGGIELELTGRRWEGAGVDLRSTNGGVRIRIPDGYSAELETGTVNGGMELDFPVMVQGRIDRTLRTRLGEGGPLIRVITTNGGVSLERT